MFRLISFGRFQKQIIFFTKQKSYFSSSVPFNDDKIEVIIEERSPINESLPIMRKRIYYQSTKRGIRENDILLGSFVRQYVNQLNKKHLHDYDKLLKENDWDIYKWITKSISVPEELDTEVMKLLQEHTAKARISVINMI